MRSPLHRLDNAKLWIESPTYEMVYDDDGNPYYEKTTIVYNAYCKQTTRTGTTEFPGMNVKSLFITGFLTDPLDLPATVNFPLEVDAVIDGIKGRLELLPMLSSPSKAHLKAGRKIHGWFIWNENT